MVRHMSNQPSENPRSIGHADAEIKAAVSLPEEEQRIDLALVSRYGEGDFAALEVLAERYQELLKGAYPAITTDEVPPQFVLFEQAARTYREKMGIPFSEWAQRVVTREGVSPDTNELPTDEVKSLVAELADVNGKQKIRYVLATPLADKLAAMEQEIMWRPYFAEKLQGQDWYQTASDSVQRSALRQFVLRLGEISRMSAVHQPDGKVTPMRTFDTTTMGLVCDQLFEIELPTIQKEALEKPSNSRQKASSTAVEKGTSHEPASILEGEIPALTRSGEKIKEKLAQVLPTMIGMYQEGGNKPSIHDLLRVDGRAQYQFAHLGILEALRDFGVFSENELAELSGRSTGDDVARDIELFRRSTGHDERTRFLHSFNYERLKELIEAASPEHTRELLERYGQKYAKERPEPSIQTIISRRRELERKARRSKGKPKRKRSARKMPLPEDEPLTTIIEVSPESQRYAEVFLSLVDAGLRSTQGHPSNIEKEVIANELTPLLDRVVGVESDLENALEKSLIRTARKEVSKFVRLAIRIETSINSELAAAREALPSNFTGLSEPQRLQVYRLFIRHVGQNMRRSPISQLERRQFFDGVEKRLAA